MAPPPFGRKPQMRSMISCLLAALILAFSAPLQAETAAEILAANSALVEKASRQTIAPVIDALAVSGDPAAAAVLTAWAQKGLGIRKADQAFFRSRCKMAAMPCAICPGPGPDKRRNPKSSN